MWEEHAGKEVGCVAGVTDGAASSWAFRGLGLSVCFYTLVSLIGRGSNGSWPHCVSLLAFSDWGPKGHLGAKALQMEQQQKIRFKKKQK